MNGVLALVSLMHQSRYSGLLQRTVGIIFDSCPVHTDKENTYRQVLEHQIGRYFDESLIGRLQQRALIWLLVKKHQFDIYKVHFQNRVLGYRMKDLVQYIFLKEHPEMPENQLYLYSDADEICDSSQIRDFHNDQIQLGKRVHHRNFIDSPHCGHYRKYAEEYQKLIKDFLNLSLSLSSKL